MQVDAVLELFQIMWNNISICYVISCVISISALIGTWYYTKNLQCVIKLTKTNEESENKFLQKQVRKNTPEEITNESLDTDEIPIEVLNLKEQLEVKKVHMDLTDEQKIAELKIQNQQLVEIFKMIEDQNDKYGINSVADMEEQMKMYYS